MLRYESADGSQSQRRDEAFRDALPELQFDVDGERYCNARPHARHIRPFCQLATNGTDEALAVVRACVKETPGMQAARDALRASKRMGHIACVAHAVGVYPA